MPNAWVPSGVQEVMSQVSRKVASQPRRPTACWLVSQQGEIYFVPA